MPQFSCRNCSYECAYDWVGFIAVHNTAQNSSENLLSYPPDNHHLYEFAVCLLYYYYYYFLSLKLNLKNTLGSKDPEG